MTGLRVVPVLKKHPADCAICQSVVRYAADGNLTIRRFRPLRSPDDRPSPVSVTPRAGAAGMDRSSGDPRGSLGQSGG